MSKTPLRLTVTVAEGAGSTPALGEVPQIAFIAYWPGQTEHLGQFILETGNRVAQGDTFWLDGTDLQAFTGGDWTTSTSFRPTITGLPAWLSYNSTTGILSYDETHGVGDVTLTLTDGSSNSQTFLVRALLPTVIAGGAATEGALKARLPVGLQNLESVNNCKYTAVTNMSAAPTNTMMVDNTQNRSRTAPSCGLILSGTYVPVILNATDPTKVNYAPLTFGAKQEQRYLFGEPGAVTQFRLDYASSDTFLASTDYFTMNTGSAPSTAAPLTPNPFLVYLKEIDFWGRTKVGTAWPSSVCPWQMYVTRCRFRDYYTKTYVDPQDPTQGTKFVYGLNQDTFTNDAAEGFTLESYDHEDIVPFSRDHRGLGLVIFRDGTTPEYAYDRSYTGQAGARAGVPLNASKMEHWFWNCEFDRAGGASLKHYMYLHGGPNAWAHWTNLKLRGGGGNCSALKSTRRYHRVRNSSLWSYSTEATKETDNKISKMIDFVSDSDTVIYNNEIRYHNAVGSPSTNGIFFTSRNTIFCADGPAYPDQYFYKRDLTKYPSTGGWRPYGVHYTTANLLSQTTVPTVNGGYHRATDLVLQMRYKAPQATTWAAWADLTATAYSRVKQNDLGAYLWQDDHIFEGIDIRDLPIVASGEFAGCGVMQLRVRRGASFTPEKNWARLFMYRAGEYGLIAASAEWFDEYGGQFTGSPWAEYGPKAYHPIDGQPYWAQVRTARSGESFTDELMRKHYISYNTMIQTNGPGSNNETNMLRDDGSFPQSLFKQGTGKPVTGNVPANWSSPHVNFLVNNDIQGWSADAIASGTDENSWVRTSVVNYQIADDPYVYPSSAVLVVTDAPFGLEYEPGPGGWWSLHTRQTIGAQGDAGPYGADHIGPPQFVPDEALVLFSIGGVWAGNRIDSDPAHAAEEKISIASFTGFKL